MDRRAFLGVAGGLVALSACAKTPPPNVVEPTPTPTPTPKVKLSFYSGSTPVEKAVRGVLAQATTDAGYDPSVDDIQTADVNGMLLDLSDDPAGISLGFATSLLNSLASGQEAPAADELLPTLAALVAGSATILSTTPLDGKIVWAVPASSELTSLADLKKWSAKETKNVSVPTFVGSRPDGIPSLAVVYGANIEAQYADDPLDRRRRLNAGEVELAAFRACDFSELDGLRILEDPTGVTATDPMVVLLNPALPDAHPEAVLAFTAALKEITPENFASVEADVAAGKDAATVASDWLNAEGLG
jgi:hypothetical protein